ncbi:endo-1,4-beta-xylanase [bacterium]|nr:endo-1,4-beta-xylanase [bacterium]
MKRILASFIALYTGFAAMSSAQTIPPGGTPVVAENAIVKMNISNTSMASKKTIAVEGQSFTQAVQIQTKTKPANTWDIQLQTRNTQAVSKDDVLLAAFWARAAASSSESGEAYSAFVFEIGADPWTKSADFSFSVIGEWKQFFVPFTALQNFSVNQANIHFRLGYAPQTLELADFQCLNYFKTLKEEDLPVTPITYIGMEDDAAWRETARQRIDRYRKADIAVKVLDASGNPVPGSSAHVEMLKHAYKFGSAVTADMITNNTADGETYRSVITDHFNRVVMENDLKWPNWERTDTRTRTLNALDWLTSEGIEIRGHCLVWPSWNHMPDDLEQNQNNTDYLRNRVLDHIEDEAGELAGLLVDWDVVNEPYSEHVLQDILGNDVLIDWFVKTHEMDPDARLYLNDYSIISGGGINTTHQDHFYNTIQFLKDGGAPIHGIGVQCHFDSNVTPPERIWSVLDRFAGLGLPIQSTEFDINAKDPNLKTLYMRDFMTTFFSHPATVGIIMWGFWENRHWRPDAALWTADWDLNPWGRMWVDLVTKTWWTDEALVPDASGDCLTRGFLGDYRVTVEAGSVQKTAYFSLGSGGVSVTLNGQDLSITHGEPSGAQSRAGAPERYTLYQPYPNPCNPSATIRYLLPRKETISLRVYDVRGREVKTLVEADQPAGDYYLNWNGRDHAGRTLASGLYIVHMEAGPFSDQEKIMLLR